MMLPPSLPEDEEDTAGGGTGRTLPGGGTGRTLLGGGTGRTMRGWGAQGGHCWGRDGEDTAGGTMRWTLLESLVYSLWSTLCFSELCTSGFTPYPISTSTWSSCFPKGDEEDTPPLRHCPKRHRQREGMRQVSHGSQVS